MVCSAESLLIEVVTVALMVIWLAGTAVAVGCILLSAMDRPRRVQPVDGEAPILFV